MRVLIKNFNVDMEVKSKGLELEVRTPDSKKQLGDCYVTMTGLVWCKGKTDKQNGIKLSWDELADILTSTETRKSAIQAAKKTEA